MITVSAALPLEGAYNVRDLGGYPAAGGQTVRKGQFLRGASLSHLTASDRTFLLQYGLAAIIDLRSPFEAERNPDPDFGIPVFSFPLLDSLNSKDFQGALPESLSQMYIQLLDQCSSVFAAIFRFMSQSDGCALFHCTAGKDRTGLCAMLLLSLAGVDDDTIIADYAASDDYLQDVILRQRSSLLKEGITVNEELLHAAPENMKTALAHLHAQYKDAETYLSRAGLLSQELRTIRRRLLGGVNHPSL